MEKRPALGKGLSALIPDAADALATPRAQLEVDVDLLEPNQYQPRGDMNEARLEDLARSIRANGVIQPIVVRRLDEALSPRPRYQIIAGERRWRAAQRANLPTVPIIVKDVAATERTRMLEMALIENIQREDLNPMEAAAAYQRLVEEFKLTQDEIASQVGKDRATVANYLRLLKLPAEVRGNVASGALSMGHARALVALPADADQKRLARDVVAKGLSVRETEQLVGRAEITGAKASRKGRKDRDLQALEEELSETLGAGVSINPSRGGRGKLVIGYSSLDQLDEILDRLRGQGRDNANAGQHAR